MSDWPQARPGQPHFFAARVSRKSKWARMLSGMQRRRSRLYGKGSMAYSDQQLQSFMDGIGSDPKTNFIMLLHQADLDAQFQGDAEWGDVCRFACEQDILRGWSAG